jgi:hypothetical protein
VKITIQENCDLYCICMKPIVQYFLRKYESGNILVYGHCEKHMRSVTAWKSNLDTQITAEEVEVYRVMAS